MNSWNDNYQWEIYNEPCVWMTNERAGKEASAKGQTVKLGHHGLVPNEG